jgi:hypothetical protein
MAMVALLLEPVCLARETYAFRYTDIILRVFQICDIACSFIDDDIGESFGDTAILQ